MSVPEGERSKSRLEVHVKAQLLAVHTAKILSNDNIFDPKVDKELISEIRRCSRRIYAMSRQANKINAAANHVNREMRYRLQETAIVTCDEMMAYIEIAKHVFHLRHKRMKYWAGLISDTRALLQKWKESDVSRYGPP